MLPNKLFPSRVAFGFGVLSEQQKVTDTATHKIYSLWIAAPVDSAFPHHFGFFSKQLRGLAWGQREPEFLGFPRSDSLSSGLPSSELVLVSSCDLKELPCGTSTLWQEAELFHWLHDTPPAYFLY